MPRYCPTCDRVIAKDGGRCPEDGTVLVEIGAGDDPFVGRKLAGLYTLKERIGAGGMGVVYRAWQHSIGRDVAVKIIHPRIGHEQRAAQRFMREVRIASRISQPNTVAVYDFGRTRDGLLFFAMDLVQGRPLNLVLREEGRFAVDRLVRVGVQLCDALEAAHRLAIVHRDLKPANIMVLDHPPGRDLVKVLDFGLAKSLEEDLQVRVTHIGEVVGTPRYMSPEAVRCEATDARSDLYSLGVILAELASGRPPFEAEETTALLERHLHDQPSVSDHAPPVLANVILRLLAKSPDDRYLSAAQAREALLAVGDKVGLALPPARDADLSPLEAAPTRSMRLRPDAPRWLLAAAVAAAMAGGIGVAVWRTSSRRPPEDGERQLEAVRSLAVLPFRAMEAADGDEYLGIGMADALITRLGNLSRVIVRPTSAIQRFSRPGDPLAAGRELQVDLLLDGKIQKASGRIRVTVQLINVRDGSTVWAQGFDEKSTDLFTVQDSISERVARALTLRLSGTERKQLTKHATENVAAYQLYQIGRYHLSKRTGAGFAAAIEYFQQAIDKDPRYAAAYSGIADAHLLLGWYHMASPEASFPKAKAAAARALAIDSELAEAHASLAYVSFLYDWDWAAADKGFQRAIQLNPNYATAHHWYALYLSGMGRHKEALQEMERAQALDPLSLAINSGTAMVLFLAGDYRGTETQCRKVLAMNPDFGPAHLVLSWAAELEGRRDEQIAEFAKWLRVVGDKELAAGLEREYAAGGYAAAVRENVHQLLERAAHGYVSTVDLAYGFMRLGNQDEALRWLERGAAEHAVEMPFLKVSPVFKPLEPHPRYRALLGKLGLL